VERIRRVSQLIEGFENPHGMELLASVHWVLRTDAPLSPEALVSLLGSWNARKAKLFPRAHILAAHDRLVAGGWASPCAA
jgi:hypothetical protein